MAIWQSVSIIIIWAFHSTYIQLNGLNGTFSLIMAFIKVYASYFINIHISPSADYACGIRQWERERLSSIRNAGERLIFKLSASLLQLDYGYDLHISAEA